MIFPSKSAADQLWEAVKQGIRTGDLWHAKISTAKPGPEGPVIIIYTKDFTDIPDVVEVLNYLEKSSTKPPNKVIRYKTDMPTLAGVYAGGKQKASIYSSYTIRNQLLPEIKNIFSQK